MTSIALYLIEILVEIARRIGRWFVKKLTRWALTKLLHYAEGRVELFQERLARAKKKGWKRNAAWQRFRIGNWLYAIATLKKHRARLEESAVRAYCKASRTALSKIPMYAPHETCPAEAVAA